MPTWAMLLVKLFVLVVVFCAGVFVGEVKMLKNLVVGHRAFGPGSDVGAMHDVMYWNGAGDRAQFPDGGHMRFRVLKDGEDLDGTAEFELMDAMMDVMHDEDVR